MINPAKLMQMKGAWDAFTVNHPKFVPFLQASKDVLREGTVIEIKVTGEDDKNVSTNLRLSREDLELFRDLTSMMM